ncbi:DUF1361 domain-containing protein [Lacihabitans sp. CCS-44]|uniref:DUF1361 domain-containing protein n=1 Tax=Lacihabitans sp. CCS-44 TaxID=2487331 RepID=UPI0020CEFCE4|nr:DUF1361 domain-containing protein [Lacihabitans sp. CCS-44]MCP9754644.1 DUF1361 domain-containing protein [Lacihabitans sp. CCS-44]
MNLKPSKPTISILILIALCSSLLIIRVYKTGTYLGLFLVWNLFLAITPIVFIFLAKKLHDNFGFQKLGLKIAITGLMTTWLLFFPNSPYIITDLMHLSHLPKHLLWFDSVGIFITALTGLVVGLYSMYNFQLLSKKLFGNTIAWFLVLGSAVLSGFGLYLGRFARFNSWDFFSNPANLIKQSMVETSNPLAMQTTLVFSIVLIGLYLSFYNLISFKHENIENASKF